MIPPQALALVFAIEFEDNGVVLEVGGFRRDVSIGFEPVAAVVFWTTLVLVLVAGALWTYLRRRTRERMLNRKLGNSGADGSGRAGGLPPPVPIASRAKVQAEPPDGDGDVDA